MHKRAFHEYGFGALERRKTAEWPLADVDVEDVRLVLSMTNRLLDVFIIATLASVALIMLDA